MPQRAIFLTVDLPQADKIDAIREQFDPLAGHVPPHITLVFPFDSEIPSEDLIDLITESIEETDFSYVEISLCRAILIEGFCFFPIKTGRDEIIDLHDRLYSTILEPYLAEEHDYVPHITVGRTDEEEMVEALKKAADRVDLKKSGAVRSIILERISDDTSSVTEFELNLRPDGSE